MSILLEALKKSEAQRQLGKTPSLHDSVSASNGGDAPAQQWLPLTLMGLSAIAMAWIGWQQFRVPEGLPPAGRDAVVAPGAAVAAREPAVDERVTAPVPEQATAPESADVSAGPPPTAGQRTLVESFATQGKSLQGVTVMPPDEAVIAAPAPKPRSGRTVAATSPAAGADASGDSGTGSPDVVQDPMQQGRLAESRDAADALPAGEPAPTEPISFWELPQGVRDSLPELRITVLVYADDPQDRFILVAGQRLLEKEELQEGVLLDEIRRDGAVFLYRKYRFLVRG